MTEVGVFGASGPANTKYTESPVSETRTIAFFGKGGVGKTSLCALMVKALAHRGVGRILAIDADPAAGLAFALGVEVIKTIDDIRRDLVARLQEGLGDDRSATLHLLEYEVFEALTEEDGVAFLSIGRPEDEGCYCRVNYLLRDILRDLAGNFDIVLIDGEAGIEQINRRVMKTVDHLVLVTDTSARGLNVTRTIAHVARDNRAVDYRQMGLVVNRAREWGEVEALCTQTDLPLVGWVPEDEWIRSFDFQGRALSGLPEESPARAVVDGILETLGF